MKNLLLTLTLCVFVAYSVNSQNANYYNRMNQVFGSIDKSKVTTGLLKEFGVRLNEVEAYNGVSTVSTNWVDKTQFHSLYTSMYSMRVGTATTMDDPSIVISHIRTQQNLNPTTVLLAAEYFVYQQYKSDAYSNGDVTVSNDQISDVVGRNPYESKNAFAVTPLKYNLTGSSLAFKLQSNLIYGNSGMSLSSAEIDFGDGLGYQTLTLNSTINVTYGSGGEKELKARFTYNGSLVLLSHSKIFVDIGYTPTSPAARYSGSGISTQVITGASYNGSTATGNITIETAGTDGVLDKPLIVVEGFDPNNDYGFINFVSRNVTGGIQVLVNGAGLTLNQAIENQGYDLVFVDFANGTDFIQRNAYMVEEVIQWVNDHKTGSEQNVVMGMSMGGLVARYALRHMETTNRIHQTKLYISHDSPQQGANAPLAFQAFVRHLSGESVSWPVFLSLFDIQVYDLKKLAPELEEGLNTLQSPAAQQMLIYQLSGTGTSISIDNSPHSSFASEYQSLGYPQQSGIRNIAISNGSECGETLNFSPYDNLINVDAKQDLPWFTTNLVFTILNAFSLNPIRAVTSFLSANTDVKAQFNMKALPNQQSQQIYSGKIFIKKSVLGFINVEEQLIDQKTFNSSASMLPIDNSGGGVYDINQFATLPPELSQYILKSRFNFVPTFSSLDIGSGSQTIDYNDIARIYSPAIPPLAPKNTPFHNFFSNPVVNESHIQFTTNNGNWLLTELSGSPAFYFCATACTTPPTLQMIGTDIICTSVTYSLQSTPLGTTPVWTSSNSSAVSIGASTGIATRVGSFSGQVTITATINGTCGNLSVSRTVTVGTLQPNFTGPSYDICDYRSGSRASATYTVSNVLPNLTYSWEVLDGGTVVMSMSGTSVTIVGIQLGQGSYVLRVRSNSCGTSSAWKTKNIFVVSCGSGSRASAVNIHPNPTSEELAIDLQDSTLVNATYDVQLVDQSQKTRASATMKGTSIKLKVNHLPEGDYILIIKNKDADIRRHIWIKR